MVAVMVVELTAERETGVEESRTMLSASIGLKSVPVIVTTVPTGPEEGDTAVSVGIYVGPRLIFSTKALMSVLNEALSVMVHGPKSKSAFVENDPVTVTLPESSVAIALPSSGWFTLPVLRAQIKLPSL